MTSFSHYYTTSLGRGRRGSREEIKGIEDSRGQGAFDDAIFDWLMVQSNVEGLRAVSLPNGVPNGFKGSREMTIKKGTRQILQSALCLRLFLKSY